MEIITTIFSGPILPATLFLCVLLGWSLLAILGTVDIDIPGTDLDADVDFDVDMNTATAADSVAFLTLRWLNISRVPLVVWMGCLSIVWWFLSASLWTLVDSRFFESPGWIWSSILALRNLLLATLITKWLTQPMNSWFVVERLAAQNLVGKECFVSSSEATPEFGQVKFKTDGAPLLLNVRTDGAHLAQGAHVWITHYDSKRRVYIITPTTADPVRVDSTPEDNSAS